MITDAFQPLVGDPDDDEITGSLERHHNYSLWDLWDEQRSQLAKSTGLGRKRARQGSRPAAPSVTTPEKPALRRSVTKVVRTRKSANKTRPAAKRANTRSRARKANRTNGSRKTNVRKTILRTSAKTASHQPKSRKASIKAARKGAPARRVATA